MDSLQSEQDLCQQILQIQFQQSPRIDLRLRLLSATAGMAHVPLAAAAQYHHFQVKPERGGTAMLRMVSLQSRTLPEIGNDLDLDPESGPMTGTFDVDVGRAALRNEGGTVIQRNMTLGKSTGEAIVWIKVESQKNAVQSHRRQLMTILQDAPIETENRYKAHPRPADLGRTLEPVEDHPEKEA